MSHRYKILVVDDQDDVRKLIKMILALEEYEIIEAHDGASAIAQLQKHRPDLILLDAMMPGYPNGLELLEMIKRNKIMSIKIIMVSAKGQQEDIMTAARLGCDAYVVKPFTRKHLLDTVNSVMQ